MKLLKIIGEFGDRARNSVLGAVLSKKELGQLNLCDDDVPTGGDASSEHISKFGPKERYLPNITEPGGFNVKAQNQLPEEVCIETAIMNVPTVSNPPAAQQRETYLNTYQDFLENGTLPEGQEAGIVKALGERSKFIQAMYDADLNEENVAQVLEAGVLHHFGVDMQQQRESLLQDYTALRNGTLDKYIDQQEIVNRAHNYGITAKDIEDYMEMHPAVMDDTPEVV